MLTLPDKGAVPAAADWRKIVANFQRPDTRRSLWQLINSVLPYVGMWLVMYWSLSISYWLTLALSVLASGFMVRVFIIFHDCGHGSFFNSQRGNDVTGILTGIMTFTPYYAWRHSHAIHHATSGDLDRRGVGDVWTLTVDEYLVAPRWKRAAYRFFRFPLVTFGLGPLFMFLISHRLVDKSATGAREHRFAQLHSEVSPRNHALHANLHASEAARARPGRQRHGEVDPALGSAPRSRLRRARGARPWRGRSCARCRWPSRTTATPCRSAAAPASASAAKQASVFTSVAAVKQGRCQTQNEALTRSCDVDAPACVELFRQNDRIWAACRAGCRGGFRHP